MAKANGDLNKEPDCKLYVYTRLWYRLHCVYSRSGTRMYCKEKYIEVDYVHLQVGLKNKE